ncbi:hypothetical protein GCM10018781_14220 [Kitasatospora indigofera]|uniref:Uncharacterized protein n=1 Tax=Kitasatospora indigofera TaxID=67307 RepID=A0A919FG25_9ACTN|nr:hypothetical protein GCM10018781_14220 [Kitasatospora indigofera]
MNGPLLPAPAAAGPVSGATAPAAGPGPDREGGPLYEGGRTAEPPCDRAATDRYRVGNTCAARPRRGAR